MPPGHPIPPRPLSGVGLGSKPSKVGTGTQTGIRICGLQVRPLSRLGQSDPEPLGVTATEGSVHSRPTFLQSQDLYVTNRYPDSNRKAGTPGTSPHEANPVASQKTLEGSRISGKRDSSPKVSSPEPTMVDQGDQCLTRSTSAPLASCHSNIYSRLKRRLGCSLRRLYNKRCLVSARKPPSHKFPRTEGGLAGLEKVPAPSARKGGANCYRQQVVAYINKEGGMRSGSLCALLWRLLSWCNLRQVVLKARHIPGCLNVIADKLSRQAKSFRRNGLFIRRFSTFWFKPGTFP